MKAFHVYDANGNYESDEIVFAETAGRAKLASEVSNWCDFVNVRAKRKPQFDKYAEQGFVPKQELLEDGWWFECYGSSCSAHLTIDDKPTVTNERIYCVEHSPKDGDE